MQQSQQITKRLLIVGDSIVKNIKPYKMKKSTKYVTTVKSIPGATTEGMSHHVKGCMVDFAPDVVLLHCGTNDFKKDLTPQKIAHNILRLAKEVSDGAKSDVLVSGIINRGDVYHAKVQKVNEFLSEIRTRKNVKYIDNGKIGLDMLNRSKLHLNRFGAIQLVKNYREILKTWHHIKKPANEGIPILKPDGASSPTVKLQKTQKFQAASLIQCRKAQLIP